MCNKMSDVRLSNASPTLERVDARQPDSVRPSSVRRCLFGTPDREGIRRDLEATTQEDVQRFRGTYNFDPVSDTPLPGDFEWQEDSDAPEFFRRPPHGSQRPRRDVDLRGSNSRQDIQERTEGHPERPSGRDGKRKRPANGSGPCSTEQPSKNARTNADEDEDDEEQSDGAASLPVEPSTKPEVQ